MTEYEDSAKSGELLFKYNLPIDLEWLDKKTKEELIQTVMYWANMARIWKERAEGNHELRNPKRP